MSTNSKILSKQKRLLIFVSVIALVIVSIMSGTGTVLAESECLSNGYTGANLVSVPILPQSFITATTDFSFNLFRKSINMDKNSLVSPTSVAMALGMTANGANETTLDQFLTLLGQNKLSLKQINYFNFLMSNILKDSSGNCKFNLANSIWYRNNIAYSINRDFLQTNADFYKASIYKADFTQQSTLTDINSWVNYNTNGLIKQIIDRLNPDTVMFLINALSFEADWQNQFSKEATEGYFNLKDGSSVRIPFLKSEDETYLEGGNATGFIKTYKGGKYSFVAMLPDYGTSLQDYINSLDANKFKSFIDSRTLNQTAKVGIPGFGYGYNVNLVQPLTDLGLVDAFSEDKANFSNMVSDNRVFIGDVQHKTFIQFSEVGTKAGAVTVVQILPTAGPGEPIKKEVYFNRPFVYAIVESGTNIPIFIGTVMNPTSAN